MASFLGEPGERRTVRSWKEIAAHLGVTVRSAQRWEHEGLPVHRKGNGEKAHVFAFIDELDRWFEVFADRPRHSERVKRWLSRTVWAAAGTGLIAALGAIVWVGGVLTSQPLPHKWFLDGPNLRVMDDHNRLCWSAHLPDLDPGYDLGHQDKALIADIDGDGRVETLFNFVPAKSNGNSGSLICFDQGGRMRWQFRYGAKRTFGGETYDPSYNAKFVKLVSANGKSLILTVANHTSRSASQAALLEPKTGRLVEEYWHPGPVSQCLLADIDADGQQELLLGALNNPSAGLGHAVLAVLKIPFSRAPRQPEASDQSLRAIAGGGELAYLMFPLPDVSRAAGEAPNMSDLSLPESRQIRVELPLPEQGGIVYYLDFHFHVQDCRFSDHFPALHERLRRQGLLTHRLSEDEVQSLSKLAVLPGAPNGNNPDLQRYWKY